MSYLEDFGMLTWVGVLMFQKFLESARLLKPEAESESEKCDMAHLCRDSHQTEEWGHLQQHVV